MAFNVIDDAVSWVRNHAERFFITGKPNEFELVRSVWMDAILCDAKYVVTVHRDGFWIVGASTDWLEQAQVSVEDLFTKLLPLPAAGPNSVRSEVLLNAFCADVWAASTEQVQHVKGAGEIEHLLAGFSPNTRALYGP